MDIYISSDNEVRKCDNICVNNYFSMRKNAMDCLNSYVSNKLDDEVLFWFDNKS